MKRLMLIAALLLTATVAWAQNNVVLVWDPMPAGQTWQFVRIYERTGPVTAPIYTQVAEVAGTATTATIPNVSAGVHYYIARSFTAGWGESGNSNEVSTPPPASIPRITSISITITVP